MSQLTLIDHNATRQPIAAGHITPLRITEIILAPGLSNSFQLLLPMLGALIQEQRWIAWIDPPSTLLQQWHARKDKATFDKLMILRSRSADDAVSLMTKALSATTCHTVVAWTEVLSSRQMQALESAATFGNSHGILLRHSC
jgi:cell division inhibitor SulA